MISSVLNNSHIKKKVNFYSCVMFFLTIILFILFFIIFRCFGYIKLSNTELVDELDKKTHVNSEESSEIPMPNIKQSSANVNESDVESDINNGKIQIVIFFISIVLAIFLVLFGFSLFKMSMLSNIIFASFSLILICVLFIVRLFDKSEINEDVLLTESVFIYLICAFLLYSLFESRFIAIALLILAICYMVSCFIRLDKAVKISLKMFVSEDNREQFLACNFIFHIIFLIVITIMLPTFNMFESTFQDTVLLMINGTADSTENFQKTNMEQNIIPKNQNFIINENHNIEIGKDKYSLFIDKNNHILLYIKDNKNPIFIGECHDNILYIYGSNYVNIGTNLLINEDFWQVDISDYFLRFSDGVNTVIGPNIKNIDFIKFQFKYVEHDDKYYIDYENGISPLPSGSYILNNNLFTVGFSHVNKFDLLCNDQGHFMYYPDSDVQIGESKMIDGVLCMVLDGNITINNKNIFTQLNGALMYFSSVSKKYEYIDSIYDLDRFNILVNGDLSEHIDSL